MDLLHFCSIKRILQDIHSIPSGPGQSGVWLKNSADPEVSVVERVVAATSG